MVVYLVDGIESVLADTTVQSPPKLSVVLTKVTYIQLKSPESVLLILNHKHWSAVIIRGSGHSVSANSLHDLSLNGFSVL